MMLIGLWTDRNVDFWASYIKGHPVDVNYWWSVLLSIFGPVIIVANIVSEILRAIVLA
jgi:hypothetical protein